MWSQIKAEYEARISDWYWAITQFKTDFGFACPSRMFAEEMLHAGRTVFAYKFSQPPSMSQSFLLGPHALQKSQRLFGAYHGSELYSVWGNPEIPAWHAKLNEREVSLADKVGRHWLNMADSANPKGGWFQLKASRRNWLLLGTDGITIDEGRLMNCTQIDRVRALTRRQPWKLQGPPQHPPLL